MIESRHATVTYLHRNRAANLKQDARAVRQRMIVRHVGGAERETSAKASFFAAPGFRINPTLVDAQQERVRDRETHCSGTSDFDAGLLYIFGYTPSHRLIRRAPWTTIAGEPSGLLSLWERFGRTSNSADRG